MSRIDTILRETGYNEAEFLRQRLCQCLEALEGMKQWWNEQSGGDRNKIPSKIQFLLASALGSDWWDKQNHKGE